MTTKPGDVGKAHRLLAPRIAYLIGTRASNGEANLIPVSNVTSISTSPQLIVVAVLKRWQTYANLLQAPGFTVSVPTADHSEGVWKLGARYSGYDFPDRPAKLRTSALALADNPHQYGPVLADGLGWLSCQVVARPDFGGDHGVFIGEIVAVQFNPDRFGDDGAPSGDLDPLMQVTGNRFATTAEGFTIPYGPDR